jgi:hypothetical protein
VSTVFEDFDTDSFGNITKVVRTERSPTTTLATTTTETLFRPFLSTNLDAWLIALPERTTVTDRIAFTTPSRTETRTTEFTYYPGTNLLHHVTREPNSQDFYLDTEFVRFAGTPFGNVDQVVQTTRGPEPERRTAVTYTADGTFPSALTRPHDRRALRQAPL